MTYLDLSDEQKKVYKQMKQEALAFLNGKMVTSATVITQLDEITSDNLWSFQIRRWRDTRS